MLFLSAVTSTINFIYSFFVAWTTRQTIIGAYCLVDWKDEVGQPVICYISFSEPPQIYGDVDLEMDDFGVMDDDVFYYATHTELLKRLWTKSIDGWKVRSCRLVVAEVLE